MKTLVLVASGGSGVPLVNLAATFTDRTPTIAEVP